MAGMLLGETRFRHQVEADIRPFRDLLLGLFFATIGMQLDPAALAGAPAVVLLLLVALTIGKAGILVPLTRSFGQQLGDAWRAAICLAQGGEFGLLLVASAMALGLLDATMAQPALGALTLSMVVAPLSLRFNRKLAGLIVGYRSGAVPLDAEARIAEASRPLSGHVIICGYGRIGQNLAGILRQEGFQVLALDLDPERASQAVAAGAKVLYGNAVQPGVLRAAGIDRARGLAITIDDAAVAAKIVSHVRAAGAELPILARSTRGHNDEVLIATGAEVFPEGLEASLAFAGQVLIMLGTAPSRVEALLNNIRAEDYAALRVFFHGSREARRDARDYPQQVRAIVVGEGHYAAGRTPQELGIAGLGVELVDVRRGAMRVPGRLLDTRLRPGDVLVVRGKGEALDQAAAGVAEGG
jgi:CPA2 family monovalent cation:H+ antiporter-2